MGLGPLKNPADNQLHPGNLAGDFLTGDGIVAPADLGDEGVSPLQNLLHPGVRCRGGLLLLFRRFQFLPLPLLQCQTAALIVPVGIVAGNQAGSFTVQMALQKQAVVDHFHQLFADKLDIFPHTPCQLFQCAMGAGSQGLAVFFEPAHPFQPLHTVYNQANTAAQSHKAKNRGNPGHAGHSRKNDCRQKAEEAEAGQQTPAHDFHDSHRGLSVGTAIQHGKGFPLLDHGGFFPHLRRPGSIIHSPGSVVYCPGSTVHRPAHRFPAQVNGTVHRMGDGLIQFPIILRIDSLVNDVLNIPAKRFPILIVVRHTILSTK